MIIFLVLLSALVWSTGKCEPPVSSYLPPPNGASNARPQAEYGPPGVNHGGFYSGNNEENQNNNRPQNTYSLPGGPGNSNSGSGTRPGTQALTRNQAGNNSPSSQYSLPNSFGQLREQPSSFGNNQESQHTGRPQPTYGPPNGNQGHRNNGFGSQSGGRRGGGTGLGEENTNTVFNGDTQGYPSGPIGSGIEQYSNDLGSQQPGIHQQSGRGPERSSSGSPSFESSQNKENTGYPNNQPRNNFSGFGSNSPNSDSDGYPRGRPEQGFNSFSNNGDPGQNSRGYPSGRPNSNNGGNFNGNGNGFPRMSSTGGGRDVSGANGYPRGGPEGARGSGY